MNREIKFLVIYIEKQKKYLKHLQASMKATEDEKDLKYLKATQKVVEQDIAQKEARLEELRREVKQNEQG